MAKKEIIATGRITEKGEFKIHESEYFKANVINNFRGKDIEIFVRRKKKIRSNPQIRYYFGVVVRMIQENLLERGEKMSVEQIDYVLRYNYMYKEEINFITAEVTRLPKALNEKAGEASTSDVMDLIAGAQQWASEELELFIPDPGQDVQEFLNEE